jgi:hypothetical protein
MNADDWGVWRKRVSIDLLRFAERGYCAPEALGLVASLWSFFE